MRWEGLMRPYKAYKALGCIGQGLGPYKAKALYKADADISPYEVL